MGTLGRHWKNTPETIANRVASRKQGAGFSPSIETKAKISNTCREKGLAPPPRPSQFKTKAEEKLNDRKNQKIWRDKNPDKVRAAQVKCIYTLTSEQHQEMLQKQGFKCAIASCPATVDIRSCIDHDHRCCPNHKSCGNCIRGILCNRHNVGLAHFQDNCDELRDAAIYLENKK